ncbi:HNH endonuclease signature motif containing protein [Metabacillus fastidiosus]|uniref:HNH endonuclease signature motif containing protein n=1 Tax=Metabacillus fastidiosus TaxID=1458 RepID=A0ABU6NRM3_9BACI|nr:HNH endonuclease signature motif containing protein [Metabacillus fastidiosus]
MSAFGFHPVAKPKHNRRVKKRGQRSEFTGKVRKQILEHFGGLCGNCGRTGEHIHHVKGRGSGTGRNVFTNGILLCNGCHTQIHEDSELMKYWQEVYEKRYGKLYFMDEHDILTGNYDEEDIKKWMDRNG